MFKVSHQIINEKTVQVYCTLQCTLVSFMIAFIHSAQKCSENDLVTAESQLVKYRVTITSPSITERHYHHKNTNPVVPVGCGENPARVDDVSPTVPAVLILKVATLSSQTNLSDHPFIPNQG